MDKSGDPWREKITLTGAADLDKPDRETPSAAKAGDVMRRAEQQPQRRDAPLGGAEAPTAEPLEDELDKQESIISQVSAMCAPLHRLL